MDNVDKVSFQILERQRGKIIFQAHSLIATMAATYLNKDLAPLLKYTEAQALAYC